MPRATSRARSVDQKLERRQSILDAADAHLRDVGFEAFTMASLAKSVGLAKGTLYLYFHTREEVFLALCETQIEHWATTMEGALTPGMDDAAFCQTFFSSAHADPTLIPLMLRLNAIIEHNVSMDALIASKRGMRNRLGRLARLSAEALGVTQDQAFDAIRALAPLLMGTSQSDQGPPLEDEDLPDDVRDFINSFDARTTFLTNAGRIVRSIRAGQ